MQCVVAQSLEVLDNRCIGRMYSVVEHGASRIDFAIFLSTRTRCPPCTSVYSLPEASSVESAVVRSGRIRAKYHSPGDVAFHPHSFILGALI